MKKYRCIFLLITIFMLSGCDATYNLTITEDKMVESASFLIDDTESNKSKLKEYFESSYTAYYDLSSRQTHYYEKEEIAEKNKIGMKLNYTYFGDLIQNSSLIDRCYYKKSISKTNDYIIIFTDGITSCFYKDEIKNLDTLTVNIKTEMNVESHNADEVNGNIYTWKIDDTNYLKKPIEMKIKLTEEEEKESNWFLWLAGLLGVIIVAGIVAIIVVLVKGKNNNKL